MVILQYIIISYLNVAIAYTRTAEHDFRYDYNNIILNRAAESIAGMM